MLWATISFMYFDSIMLLLQVSVVDWSGSPSGMFTFIQGDRVPVRSACYLSNPPMKWRILFDFYQNKWFSLINLQDHSYQNCFDLVWEKIDLVIKKKLLKFKAEGQELQMLKSVEQFTVKSRAVDRSTIQFLTIFGVLLTKTCYYPRRATIDMSSIKGFMNSFQCL